MGNSIYVSLLPFLVLFKLSGVLPLVGSLSDVQSVTCAAVAFLNIYANVSNSFKYSIPGYGKYGAGNGFF